MLQPSSQDVSPYNEASCRAQKHDLKGAARHLHAPLQGPVAAKRGGCSVGTAVESREKACWHAYRLSPKASRPATASWPSCRLQKSPQPTTCARDEAKQRKTNFHGGWLGFGSARKCQTGTELPGEPQLTLLLLAGADGRIAVGIGHTTPFLVVDDPFLTQTDGTFERLIFCAPSSFSQIVAAGVAATESLQRCYKTTAPRCHAQFAVCRS